MFHVNQNMRSQDMVIALKKAHQAVTAAIEHQNNTARLCESIANELSICTFSNEPHAIERAIFRAIKNLRLISQQRGPE